MYFKKEVHPRMIIWHKKSVILIKAQRSQRIFASPFLLSSPSVRRFFDSFHSLRMTDWSRVHSRESLG